MAAADAVERSLWNDGAEYEYEDPADSWLALVEACHEPDHVLRRQRVEQCLMVAKSSHWTREKWLDILSETDYDDIDWGAPIQPKDDSTESMEEAAATLGSLVDDGAASD